MSWLAFLILWVGILCTLAAIPEVLIPAIRNRYQRRGTR